MMLNVLTCQKSKIHSVGKDLSLQAVRGGTAGSTATSVDSCGVQHESTAICPDPDGLECTLRDGDLRLCTAVDVLPADDASMFVKRCWGSRC